MPVTDFKGVFDIPPPGGGLNDSERLLVRLCRQSFLSLWAIANLHTDEGFNNGRGSAKEFTDALLLTPVVWRAKLASAISQSDLSGSQMLSTATD
jgi:hypothetical protein